MQQMKERNCSRHMCSYKAHSSHIVLAASIGGAKFNMIRCQVHLMFGSSEHVIDKLGSIKSPKISEHRLTTF